MLEKIRHYIYRAKGATEQVLLEDREKSSDKDKLTNELLHGETKQERFISLLRLIKSILPENLINQINRLALRADYETELLEKFQVSPDEEFKKELKELKKEYTKKKLEQIEKEVQIAEKNKDR